jgi:hypothetical protein
VPIAAANYSIFDMALPGNGALKSSPIHYELCLQGRDRGLRVYRNSWWPALYVGWFYNVFLTRHSFVRQKCQHWDGLFGYCLPSICRKFKVLYSDLGAESSIPCVSIRAVKNHTGIIYTVPPMTQGRFVRIGQRMKRLAGVSNL